MAARQKAPAVEPAGAPEPEKYEVVGDELVCRLPDGERRLSLSVPMPAVELFWEITSAATVGAREQVVRFHDEVMPEDARRAVDEIGAKDGVLRLEMIVQWAKGLDVRLGKALS